MTNSKGFAPWPGVWQNLFCSLVGATGIACVLLYSTGWDPWPSLFPTLLFAALIAAATRLGLPLGRAGKVSVAHTLTVASFLALGFPAALWATLLGSLVSDLLRTVWPLEGEASHRPRAEAFRALTLNAGAHLLALVTGAALFFHLGGTLPVTSITAKTAIPLTGLFLGYFLVDLGYFTLYQAMRGEPVLPYFGRQFPRIAVVELLPQPLSVLVATVYHQGDWGNFLILLLGGLAGTLLVYSLDLSRLRLQERVEELSALNAIGRDLSRSLDLDTLLEVIYREAGKVLNFRNFYVALYDAEAQMLHFPLVYEGGDRRTWRSRPFQSGLTEYVIRTRKPLLIREDERVEAARLGIQPIGRPARSWLGIPLLAGDQVLGVLAVQDYDQPHAYTEADVALLSTIASQAAVAIRNAQLYQQTDAQLAHRLQQLQAVLDSTDEGFLFLDAAGTILMANPRLHALWRAEPGTLVGRSLLSDPALQQWAGFPSPFSLDDLVRLSQEQARVLVIWPKAANQIAERTIRPVRDPRGGEAGWLLTFRDVTEEQKLAQLREDLSQMMVHDLRSPLSGIATALKMLQEMGDEIPPEQRAQLVDMGLRGVERLDTMIHTLLEIGRLQSGDLRPERVPLPPAEVVQAVVRRFTPLAAEARIRIQVDLEENLPLAYADLSLVERVLANLLDNALKFSPDGSVVTLSGSLVQEAGGAGQWLRIAVRDQGPGVPPAYREAIFEKFGQVRNAPSRRRGAGLGLTFCRLAVEAHGGRIGLENPPEGGSIFWFTLPVATPEDLAPPLPQE